MPETDHMHLHNYSTTALLHHTTFIYLLRHLSRQTVMTDMIVSATQWYT